MANRPHGQARVNPSSPRAFAICDRCSRLFNLESLSWQYEWAGPRLQNLHLLVCRSCNDVPQAQLKPRILPPDPVPVMNARPQNYSAADDDWRTTEDEGIRVDEDDTPRVTENVANNREDAT